MVQARPVLRVTISGIYSYNPLTLADRKGRFPMGLEAPGGGADPVGRRPSFLPAARRRLRLLLRAEQ